MSAILFIVAYAAIAVFIVAVVMRFLMFKKMPLHLRWDLYPVPHEASRAHYGGSYLEEVDWWKKPREHNKIAEAKAMLEEIVFLVALKEHNPKMWRVSFPFHFGLYLVIAATVAMFGYGVLAAIGLDGTGFNTFVVWVLGILGFSGLGLGVFGAIGLLQRRLGDPTLKDYTSPADIFNLVLFIAAFGFALINTAVNGMGAVVEFVAAAVQFETGIETNALMLISVLLLAGTLVYIPLTHMSHFVGKYFAYHSIRWNDNPNLAGGAEEAEIGKVLSYPVSWSAPHIKGDGVKTWADVATADMTEEEE